MITYFASAHLVPRSPVTFGGRKEGRKGRGGVCGEGERRGKEGRVLGRKAVEEEEGVRGKDGMW